MLHRKSRRRRILVATTMLVVLSTVSAMMAVNATATEHSYIYCSHTQHPQEQCGPGPWELLFYSQAYEAEEQTPVYVCAVAENENGTFTHYYCGAQSVSAGPYCECQTRAGWDQNGSASLSIRMFGQEVYVT